MGRLSFKPQCLSDLDEMLAERYKGVTRESTR